MKSPFRKGTAVTNRTNLPIAVHCVGPGGFIKNLGKGEAIFLGPEIYNSRMVAIRRAIDPPDHTSDHWLRPDPQVLEHNAELLVRWNEATQRLESEARKGNRLGRSMGALILRRTVGNYVEDLREKVRRADAARAFEDDIPTEDQEPTVKNPFRKGTAVTNRTNHEIAVHFVGSTGFIKLLREGETIFLGPETYNRRMIAIRRAIDFLPETSERWLQPEPEVLKNNAELLVRWNEETRRLEMEVRRGNRLERSMGGFIIKRTVKTYVKGLTAKLRA